MKEDALKKINELGRNPNNVLRVVGKMNIESIDFDGGMCMRGNIKTHYLNEKDRGKFCREHIKKIMNKENGWDQIAEADTV